MSAVRRTASGLRANRIPETGTRGARRRAPGRSPKFWRIRASRGFAELMAALTDARSAPVGDAVRQSRRARNPIWHDCPGYSAVEPDEDRGRRAGRFSAEVSVRRRPGLRRAAAC